MNSTAPSERALSRQTVRVSMACNHNWHQDCRDSACECACHTFPSTGPEPPPKAAKPDSPDMPVPSNKPKYLRHRDALIYLGICKSTFRKYRKLYPHMLPQSVLGGSVWFRVSDLDRLIEANFAIPHPSMPGPSHLQS